MTSYCEAAELPYHGPYHSTEYGFPIHDDNALFERLILEINQAGLSWLTILKKRETFRLAYEGFDLTRVAAYGEADRQRLMADPGIIRNRLKIAAAIENANRILALQAEWGSFTAWLDHHHGPCGAAADPLDAWRRLFKKTFVFTGGEIVNEFLMSTGYLPGAHREECPVYTEILALQPAWYRASTVATVIE